MFGTCGGQERRSIGLVGRKGHGLAGPNKLGGNEVVTLSKFIELAVGPATGAALAAVLAWLVGQRISARWSVWQKRRESSLAAVSEFGRLYGEFFSIWKLWNYSLHADVEAPEEMQWHLLERAASAEAAVESLLVRLACQTSMTRREVEIAIAGRRTAIARSDS